MDDPGDTMASEITKNRKINTEVNNSILYISKPKREFRMFSLQRNDD
jgi:hypothetical protein